MAYVIDNLIAYRVLSMLVKPFTDTDAYKLGIIDDKGTNLIKASKFTKMEQRHAYTYLHRLVFNLKKLLNKLPGGESMTKNLIAAFFLLREAQKNNVTKVDEQDLERIIELLDSGVTLAEEQLVVEEFLLLSEDAPTNSTGAAVSTDTPKIRRRFARFVVNDEVFRRFSNGKSKTRKWSEYLNLEDEGQNEIYKFAKKNPNGVIILQNGKESKSIRFNHRGGGGSKPKRPARQVNNEVL